jgi:hypothetical protein
MGNGSFHWFFPEHALHVQHAATCRLETSVVLSFQGDLSPDADSTNTAALEQRYRKYLMGVAANRTYNCQACRGEL